ncbi:pyroglutamyl-peptidase I [Georgenia sp. 10Sc9-8]|uniref:Pyroglutamyl-peptidase I n=1 Tax=Georgenia halotolerans TaxID=3028317 RepID=A0ABT5TXG5_9MICO|nr:pyroglutamyl-peptidase I [Georgenia halotolerans]
MTDRPTAVVTGFGAFGPHRVNPSWSAVELLRDAGVPDVRLVTEQLPVSFARATARIGELVAEHEPAVVLCTGLAASRDVLSLERLAVNLADAPVPDVDGAQPVDERVLPEGPAALFTTLPVKAAAARLQEEGISVELSLSAGTYVCNAVMLAALHASSATAARVGFVHVPPVERLDPARAAQALEVVLRTAVTRSTDTARAGGRVD